MKTHSIFGTHTHKQMKSLHGFLSESWPQFTKYLLKWQTFWTRVVQEWDRTLWTSWWCT